MSVDPISPEVALAFGRDVYYGHGKIEILPKVAINGLRDVAIAFTPGVGHAVRLISTHPEALHEQTAKDNLIALVTNGTAVLGYGDVGPRAGMPVMEGKAIMFKMLAGVDCMPLCVDQRDPEKLADLILALEPTFGAFNLEDVAAPHCFRVMQRLRQELPVPILHDDQFGTATVITAGVINAFKALGRDLTTQRAVVVGCGAAGSACIRMLTALGVRDIVAVDRDGILSRSKSYGQEHWNAIAADTNPDNITGDLTAAMRGRDLFIGLSVGGLVTAEMVAKMAPDPVVFALANPDPEILPAAALAAGAALVASGRFDYANHCNNVLAFPSLLRAALDTRARDISISMCLAGADAIAASVPESELSSTNILPSPMLESLYPDVAEAIARCAVEENLARLDPGVGFVADNTRRLRDNVRLRQSNLPAFTDAAN